ncbi:MAG: winged helix-turn-helix transcriptional regulator, partial [Hyphomicrobiales bacterium]|nr:winged helix-turn-helix transcriptional regulator [Hyphomicrobiales bacterium]
MKEGPNLAAVAALLGDPARANMLTALMDGRALTATELAHEAGVTLQTTSGHLARLEAAHLLRVEKQGRHRYFRLSGEDVAEVLEGLMGLAARTGHLRTKPGPKDPALRQARVCYDHLAGDMGVWAFDRLWAKGLVGGHDRHVHVTERGRAFFAGF